MKRPHIDAAVHRQLDRMLALLRDVDRSGGRDRWSHLFSHGHRFPTVKSAVRQGYLCETSAYHYELTLAGGAHLAATDEAAMLAR